MCDKNGISGGEGGSVLRVNFWKIQRGGGVIGKIPSVGGGMDIFWNYTFFILFEFALVAAEVRIKLILKQISKILKRKDYHSPYFTKNIT